MEAGWRALAAEQQWLDGELAPHGLIRKRPQSEDDVSK
jgi:hypothetical protein